ncbi:MAG: hypothetical protein KDN05_16510, partial [Verrucomicrobiae bacterium]|nr:hypothetical protein [Verrucomicrobiae bacterium]
QVSNTGGFETSVLVVDPAEFETIAEAVRKAGVVALDIETYGPGKKGGLDRRNGRIRLLQLGLPSGERWIIDMMKTGVNLGELREALGSVSIVAHNARFDLGFLNHHCGLEAVNVFCTWTASKILTNGSKLPNDLFAVLERHLGIKPYADQSMSDWSVETLDEEQLAYAAADIAHLLELKEKLEKELRDNDLAQVAELEMRLIPVVIGIEEAGLPVEMEKLQECRRKARQEADQHKAELVKIAGESKFNPNSPKQVKELLGDAGLDVPDTGAETLAAYRDNPVVSILFAYRKADKMATMLEGLEKRMSGDGRIHAEFKPLGTDTGRFSSAEPNLQNLPRGDVRGIIRPSEGSKFVKADYSQIDLRAAAALANETTMLEAFGKGEDLHQITASRVTGKALDQITKQERQEAKAVNFGFIYGQGAEGFRKKALADYGLELTGKRAAELRDAFFESYPAFRKWHKQTDREARNGLSEIRTRTGRRRLLPSNLNDWQRFSQGVNSPVQGVAADGMKMALLAMHAKLPKDARIILTVHDDVLVECPEALADAVARIVETSMKEEMGKLLPEVPIEVEAEVLDRWK